MLEKIEICVTSRCNLTCSHCYQHQDKNKYHLDTDIICQALDDALIEGCKSIVFSGGEFFMHKDAMRIINYAISQPGVDVTLVTNGLLIDLSSIRKLPTEKIRFIISVDGTKEQHEARRGKDTYEKVLNNASDLVRLGFSVTANVTLDGLNCLFVPELLSELECNFTNVTFLVVGESGAASDNAQDLNLKSESLKSVVQTIYRQIERPFRERCPVFPSGVSINYDGTVYPCSVARDFGIFSMGNIHDSSLQTLYRSFFKAEKGKLLVGYSGISDLEECSACGVRNACNKGCRMRAYKWHGDIKSPDPFACLVYKDEYSYKSCSSIYWGNR